jgi:hypothetical protein
LQKLVFLLSQSQRQAQRLVFIVVGGSVVGGIVVGGSVVGGIVVGGSVVGGFVVGVDVVGIVGGK